MSETNNTPNPTHPNTTTPQEATTMSTTLPTPQSPTLPVYSPYQCAKAVNEMFAESGVDKTLPPQMFYTYTKKGYIPAHINTAGKIQVTHEDLAKWFIKYCTKNNIQL